MTSKPVSQAEYDLPWVLESLNLLGRFPRGEDPHAYTTVVTEEELRNSLSTIDYKDNCIVAGRDSVRYLADGKNLYKMDIEPPSSNNHVADETRKVTTRCVNVCDPDTFEAILENEGFDAVLEYMTEDGRHAGAAGYTPGDGFQYPDYGDDVPRVKETRFNSNTTAEQAKETVLDG